MGGQIAIRSLYDKFSFVNVEKRVSALKNLQQAVYLAPTQLTMIPSCSKNHFPRPIPPLLLYSFYIVGDLFVLNSMHEIFVTGR